MIIFYILGFVFSLLFPSLDKSIFQTIATVAVCISIPLMLISCNWKKVFRMTKEVFLSFGLLILSVALVSFAVCFKAENGSVLAGMAVALYTGGTMNLNAVATFFKLDNNLILVSNLSDMVFGGVFYAFLLVAAKPLVSLVLGKTDTHSDMYSEHENKKYTPSFLEKIGEAVSGVFIFCITAMIDLNSFKQIPWNVFLTFSLITTLSFFIHLIFCKIFHISADIMIITATAGIYGPPFVPSISKAIGAEDVMACGLVVGSLGYAVGTFLGIGFTYLMNAL